MATNSWRWWLSRGAKARPYRKVRLSERLPRYPRPWLECLEDRTAPAVFNVLGAADGSGALLPSHTPGVDFDATTLRAAANGGNTFRNVPNRINVPAGLYRLTLAGDGGSELFIEGSLTIRGAGAGLTIVDGNLTDRVFEISGGSGDSVALIGLTIQNGRALGFADSFGGGILDQNSGALSLVDTVVTGDQANAGSGSAIGGTASGGGIFVDYSAV
jgi:hypothetical protein